jgi:hypothetical protein
MDLACGLVQLLTARGAASEVLPPVSGVGAVLRHRSGLPLLPPKP